MGRILRECDLCGESQLVFRRAPGDSFKYCVSCGKKAANSNKRLLKVAIMIQRASMIVALLRRMAESKLIDGAPINNVEYEISRLECDLDNLADEMTIRLLQRGMKRVKLAHESIQDQLPRAYSGANNVDSGTENLSIMRDIEIRE